MRALWVIALGACAYEPPAGDDDVVPGCDPSWFDGAWHARETVTIDHAKVAADLANVPIVLDLQLPGVQPSGADIVVTDADGTRLAHELDTISGERAAVWVRVPELSASTDTILRVYFANPAAADTQDAATVWTDYTAVWHLAGDPTVTLRDSTGHELGATSRGGMTAGDRATGKVAGSLQFDGQDDALDVPTTTLGTTFSYEAWIRKSAGGGWRCVLDNWPDYDRWFGTTDTQLSFWDGGSNIVDNNVTLDEWSYLVATYDGHDVRVYRDGSEIGSIRKDFSSRTSTMQIGYTVPVGEFFPGRLDEIRISSVTLSQEYVATTFANQDAPTTFARAGAPETCP